MPVREDCRHYVMQTVRGAERVERCQLGVNEQFPFACPDGCVFHEKRSTSSAGWSVAHEVEDPPTP
ncbi:MAG TPA: hypothetical protein VED84_01835 [Acidimicrobiales bacterium]|nr:hypothetical protein [Acidimicrobiales bacterium]